MTAAVSAVVRQLNFGIWRHRKIICVCAMYFGPEVLHVRVSHAVCCYICACTTCEGWGAYLLPLVSALAPVSPGFSSSPVSKLLGLSAVLPLRCARSSSFSGLTAR